MYKIFLADDEFKVINGLLRSIDWDGLNSEVVGYAQDGEEALEKIGRLHPDIVIIDIRMPKKSGLEVMEQIAKEFLCSFIVFSGYTEFEYAKKALQMKAVDYLIKPVNISEIEEAIRQAIRNIETLKSAENPEKVHKQEWLASLLDGNTKVSPYFPALWNYFLYVVHFKSEYTAELDEILLSLTEKYTKDAFQFIILKSHKERIIFCAAGDRTFIPAIQKAVSSCLNALTEKYPQKIYWGSSNIISETLRIENAYMEAVDMVELREFFCNQHLGENTEKKSDFRSNDFILSHTKRLMHAASHEEAEKIISDFFQQISEHGHTPNQIRGLCLELYYSLKYQYQKDYSELFSEGTIKNDYFRRSADISNLETMKANILNFYDTINHQLHTQSTYYQQRIIHSCKTYVEAHLKETITLTSVADFVNMNPAYLSHIFKKVTGVTLFDFITDCRINKAKHLLKTSYLKIFEVAKEAGYQDQRYFCQVFKKKVGMTAAEYRNQKSE